MGFGRIFVGQLMHCRVVVSNIWVLEQDCFVYVELFVRVSRVMKVRRGRRRGEREGWGLGICIGLNLNIVYYH